MLRFGLRRLSTRSKATNGYIHSVESFSAVDGPGVRYVVFLQGCNLRCKICSNPDTWEHNKGILRTSDELVSNIKSLKSYLHPNGGITMTGGEPLVQAPFVADVFQKVKQLDLTTCLDTAGFASDHNMDLVLPHTDHVMFCIKHPDPKKYLEFTGQEQKQAMKFWEKLEYLNKNYVIRYVVVPGMTDNDEDIDKLIDMVKDTQCKGIELLPFHNLGKYKWEMMGMKYVDIQVPTKEKLNSIISKIKDNNINIII